MAFSSFGFSVSIDVVKCFSIDYIEAKVKGSSVVHKVIIDHASQRCTCDWFTAYQGKRGICKHILGVKMMVS